MEGKSELAFTFFDCYCWLKMITFVLWVVPEGLTARHSLVQYAFCVRDDWFFLIQAIDASVLTDLYWLGMA